MRHHLSGVHLLQFSCLILVSSVTAILRKLKQQSRESVEDKRPKLLKALKEVCNFFYSLAFQNHCRLCNNDFCLSLSMLINCWNAQCGIFTVLCCTTFYDLWHLCFFCSLVTFIWSCIGTFRAGVSFIFHTNKSSDTVFSNIDKTGFDLKSLCCILKIVLNWSAVALLNAFFFFKDNCCFLGFQ